MTVGISLRIVHLWQTPKETQNSLLPREGLRYKIRADYL